MTRTSAEKAKSMMIGIDIGTTKIAAVLVRVDTECPEIFGIAQIPFSGLPLTDPDMDEKSAIQITSRAIERVVNKACEAAGCSVKSAVIGISGFTESFCSQGVVPISKPVAQDDITRVLNAAASVTLPNGLILLDQVVESFIVDDVVAGADPNYSDEDGQTPLMLAVMWNLPGLARDLITAGADVNRQNAEGKTALSYVADSSPECDEIRAILLGAGARDHV